MRNSLGAKLGLFTKEFAMDQQDPTHLDQTTHNLGQLQQKQIQKYTALIYLTTCKHSATEGLGIFCL